MILIEGAYLTFKWIFHKALNIYFILFLLPTGTKQWEFLAQENNGSPCWCFAAMADRSPVRRAAHCDMQLFGGVLF